MVNMDNNQKIINGRYRVLYGVGADKSGYFLSLQDAQADRNYYAKLMKVDDGRLTAQGLFAIQKRVQRLSKFAHTNAVTIYESELTEDSLLIRQNALAGQSLRNLLQKKGRPLTMNSAFRVALDIASALAALHSEGLAHGELDPSHIWVDDRGRNYLSFLEYPPSYDTERSVYKMPELTPAAEPQPANDIFSFGVLLLEICTGISTYRSSGDVSDVEEYSRVFRYYRECLKDAAGLEAPKIVPIISRCLTDNASERYRDGEELYWALRELIEKNMTNREDLVNDKAPMQELPKAAPKPVKKEKVETPVFETAKPKKKAPVLALVLSLLLLVGAAGYLWMNKPVFTSSSETERTPEYNQTLEVLYVTQTSLAKENAEAAAEAAANVTPTETELPTDAPTLEPTATPQPVTISAETGKMVVWLADQSQMAAVPEGEFTMGMDSTFNYAMEGILPRHTVQLNAFWIDRTEVTQGQYAKCVGEGVCQPIERISDEFIGDNMPIMNVKWTDAETYCMWAGKRLPSEAEWEKAARGTDGRIYPWGNASRDVDSYPRTLSAVGENDWDVSPYGVLDMAGNVSEWTNDFFSETRAGAGTEVLVNPIGPISGNMHTIKGGAFSSSDPETASFVFNRRGSAPDITTQYGFRCVVSASAMDTSKAIESIEEMPLADELPAVEQSEDCENRAKFVNDVTIPDGTEVRAGEMLTKTWTLENYGTCSWSENYKIVWADENYDNDQKLFDIGVNLAPGEQGEISVTFPAQGEGKTHISFLLADTEGNTFGLGERGIGDLYIEYRISE